MYSRILAWIQTIQMQLLNEHDTGRLTPVVLLMVDERFVIVACVFWSSHCDRRRHVLGLAFYGPSPFLFAHAVIHTSFQVPIPN